MIKKVIYPVHVYFLLMLSTGFMVHVLMHPIVLTSSKTDSWVSVLCSFFPLMFWAIMIFHLSKKLEKKNIFTIINSLQPFISMSIKILLSLYFILTAFITCKYTGFWAKTNYTFQVPLIIMIIPFIAVCYYASLKGIKTIAAIAIFLLPLVIIFGLLVGIGNMKVKDYSMLLPLFENGYKGLFLGLMYTCASFFEVIYLLFFTPFLKNQIRLKTFLPVVLIIFLLALGPLVAAISMFGAEEAAKMKVPAYEQWKVLTLGRNITRLDFLSIFQWFSGAFIRISLSMFIVTQLFSYKKNLVVLLSIYAVLTIAVSVPWDFQSFFSFLYSFYYPASLIFFIFIFVLLFLLSKKKGDVHE
jgi:spore germination protein KB